MKLLSSIAVSLMRRKLHHLRCRPNNTLGVDEVRESLCCSKDAIGIGSTACKLARLIAALLIATQMTAGCTMARLEINRSLDANREVALNQVVAVVLQEDKNLTGRDGQGGKALAFLLLTSFTLGLSPIPGDLTFATSPEIPSNLNRPLNDPIDAGFTRFVNAALGSEDLAVQRGMRVNELIEKARGAGKRYLYLIRYREYDSIRIQTDTSGGYNYSTSTYLEATGSINMMSRVLVDTHTGAVLLNKQRIAETYFWGPIFTNGWCQGWRLFGRQRMSLQRYIKEVGAKDETVAPAVSLAYLIKQDFGKNNDGSY